MNQEIITPLVAILRGITVDEVDIHIPILIKAGFKFIEIPLNSPEWETSIAVAVKHYGEQAMIGAGTVLDVSSVDKLALLGCRLIVTPNTNVDVIKQALNYGMDVLPGCATATEAFTAIDAGAKKIKLFPSSVFGPAYIRALKSVLPAQVPVFAVGGVTPENLAEYMQAGCIGAGLGSDLFKPGQSAERTELKALAFMASYQRAKENC